MANLRQINGYDALQALLRAVRVSREGKARSVPGQAYAILAELERKGFYIGMMERDLGDLAAAMPDVPAAVPVDARTLLGREGYDKVVRIAELLAGGLGYEGLTKWLAMYDSVDDALAAAERHADGGFQ